MLERVSIPFFKKIWKYCFGLSPSAAYTKCHLCFFHFKKAIGNVQLSDITFCMGEARGQAETIFLCLVETWDKDYA